MGGPLKREAQLYLLITDLFCCAEETSTTLKSIILQILIILIQVNKENQSLANLCKRQVSQCVSSKMRTQDYFICIEVATTNKQTKTLKCRAKLAE